MTALDRMLAYQAKLKAAGKVSAAQTVARCIAYLRAELRQPRPPG